jgi:hypothetical protein
MNSLLLTGPGIATLLQPDGPDPRPSAVYWCREHGWQSFDPNCDPCAAGDPPTTQLGSEIRPDYQGAIPLVWRGKPCWSAVDAVARAITERDPAHPGWVVLRESAIIPLASLAASVLGVEVVEVP